MEKRLLIERWLRHTQPIPIYDEASVSTARQLARECGRSANLSTGLIESVALIASELTHNQLRHARQGYFAVKAIEHRHAKGLEVVAADIGTGIEKPEHAINGTAFSAAPTGLGAGLGAVCRMADQVEFDNRIAEGLCVIARKFESPPDYRTAEPAIIGRPHPEEALSGDDAVFVQTESGFVAAVSDGLGHGPEARRASRLAVEVVMQTPEMRLTDLMVAINEELTETRGCAMSIVRFEESERTLESVAVGDVQSHLYGLQETRFLTSTPSILGSRQVQPQRIRTEHLPVEDRAVLVMFTDGLKSRTTLKGRLDVLRRRPVAIGQYLLENNSRPDDDVLILVARLPREAA
jgi:anti-sigma regulatory factor (Ser/Thr protein kinase)